MGVDETANQQPDPAALGTLIRKIRKPESLEWVSARTDELLRKAGLREKGLKLHSIYAGDPDLDFGNFDKNYQAWVRRGSILVACDVNGHYDLFVLSPATVRDLTVGAGQPHTSTGRAIRVTNEPGPWWAKLREEVPKIERGLREFERLAEAAAQELRDANARRAAADRRGELSEARDVYGEAGKSGCAVVLLVLAAVAGAAAPLLR